MFLYMYEFIRTDISVGDNIVCLAEEPNENGIGSTALAIVTSYDGGYPVIISNNGTHPTYPFISVKTSPIKIEQVLPKVLGLSNDIVKLIYTLANDPRQITTTKMERYPLPLPTA